MYFYYIYFRGKINIEQKKTAWDMRYGCKRIWHHRQENQI